MTTPKYVCELAFRPYRLYKSRQLLSIRVATVMLAKLPWIIMISTLWADYCFASYLAAHREIRRGSRLHPSSLVLSFCASDIDILQSWVRPFTEDVYGKIRNKIPKPFIQRHGNLGSQRFSWIAATLSPSLVWRLIASARYCCFGRTFYCKLVSRWHIDAFELTGLALEVRSVRVQMEGEARLPGICW